MPTCATPIKLLPRLLFAAAFLLVALMPFALRAQETNITAELFAEGPAVPGEELMLAIHFTPDPGWHGYWKNPGDAGYEMQLDWQLPAGWQALEPQYPVPQRLMIRDLMNHVYKGSYTVLVPLKVPQQAVLGQSVPITLRAQWLACTDRICVPEQAKLNIIVPPKKDAAGSNRFDIWRASIPASIDQTANFAITDTHLRIAIPLPASLVLADPHIFIENPDLADYAAKQHFSRKGDMLIAELALERRGELLADVSGIFAFDDTDGVRFAGVEAAVPAAGAPLLVGTAEPPAMIILVFGALMGGLLLNIMPCVFPILSLKALSLARAGESQREARNEAIAYSGGVILACVALGGLLLVLRAAGAQVGWAFQLQEPGMVAALLALAAAITANLAGLFELPSFSITRSGKPASAFATGVLTAVVATPCTGPFMAAALGAALLLPAAQALVLFASLGTGLALPFLIIGFIPAVRGILPRPGAWMAVFRKVMAVPMGLTALALLWLSWRLGGAGLALLAALLAVGFVGAIVLCTKINMRPRWLPLLAGSFILVGVGFVSIPLVQSTKGPEAEAGLLDARKFSEAALEQARASGDPVFVWFTADWCLSCKVNESVAIEREATRRAFRKAGVVTLKGDWTRPDPAITAFLTKHGLAGIPSYIWYPPGGAAQHLDQVLTPDSLVNLAQDLP